MNTDSAISRRIFCVGLNKTGTSTMKHCFEILRLMPIASPKTYGPEVRKRIRHFYKHKNYEDMLDLAQGYRSFEDRPWNMWSMYRQLHERYPDSLFILTVRDEESWWRSTERWITVTKPEVLPRYQLHLRVHQVSRESMVESYLRYNREVEAYFAGTGKLLTMNLEGGDGWERLCKFLDVAVPAVDFPHANPQKYTPQDAEILKNKRRLKHGVECQACKQLTVVKNAPRLVKGAGNKRSIFLSLLPDNFVRKLKKLRPEDLQNALMVRRLFYAHHITLRKLKAPFLSRPYRAPENVGSELAIVSCFFNPSGSRRRLHNFKSFLSSMKRSGVRCLVVELVFGSSAFQIDGHEDIIQVRTDDVLWHKERLLNIGIRRLLDDGARKIAWLDGDIVFEDPDWPLEISARLERSNLCQVFESISICANEGGPPVLGLSAVKYFQESGQLFSQTPLRYRNVIRGLLKGGQSGFGWAARAEVLEKVPLFENAIVGGGDKLMLAASLSDNLSGTQFESLTQSKIACKACGHKNRSVAYSANFQAWAQQWSNAVGGAVDYARLHISDMYHGQRSDRGYMTRHDILYRHAFDPQTDLKVDGPCCLEWASGKKQMHREVEAYFLSRREDV
jgi:sulfotransferase family protein